MGRGIYLRADFDMAFDEYTIDSDTIENLDKDFMGFRRAQVVECNIRRSDDEGLNKIIGWTDNGFYIELIGGANLVGQRTKVMVLDIRRSFGVGEPILAGVPSIR